MHVGAQVGLPVEEHDVRIGTRHHCCSAITM